MSHALRVAAATVSCLLLATCSSPRQLKPFSSDGCSLFPDRSPNGQADWCDCCLTHDLAYWRGGTAAERQAADLHLKACVLERTGNATLAAIMYAGVRAGGGGYFPTWYRWGYGWDYTPSYRPLSADEAALADRLEAAWRRDHPRGCWLPAGKNP